MQRIRSWMPATLLAVGLLVYANSLTGPFIFDDAHGITENLSIRRLWPVWHALIPPPVSGMAGRPLVNFTFALNYALGGLNVTGYHAVNLAIHLLAGLVLFGVLRRVVKRDGFAFAVTLLWLVHPVLTESVVYVSQRTEMLMGLFLLLTLYCFLRSFDSAHAQRWHLAAIVACGLGMGCKEVMVVTPVLVLVYDYVFVTGSWTESLRRRRLLYSGLAATWLMLPFLIGGVSVLAKLGHTGEFTAWEYAKVQCTILVRYLRLCVWPAPLLLDYAGWPRVNSITQIIPHGLLIVGLVAGSFWGAWRRRWWGFLGAWFFVILAPTSSFLPLGTEIGAERRLYLPAIAIIVLLVASVWRWKPVAVGLTLAVTLAFAGMTWQRNKVYASSVAIWADTVAKVPGNARAYNNYANALSAVGRNDEAERYYRLALAADAGDWRAWFNFAGLLAEQGKFEEAIVCYRQATTIEPGNVEAWINVGVALGKREQFAEALACFAEAARLEPHRVQAHYNLGRTYAKMGRPAEAVPHYRAALELQPSSSAILYGLGNALAESGQPAEARRQLTEAARLDPSSAPVRQALEALRP